MDWLRAADSGSLQAGQVPELLLRPQLHHLPGVALAVAAAEAEVSLHIPGRSTSRGEAYPQQSMATQSMLPETDNPFEEQVW